MSKRLSQKEKVDRQFASQFFRHKNAKPRKILFLDD